MSLRISSDRARILAKARPHRTHKPGVMNRVESEGEHEMPGWEAAPWKAPRGYSNKGARREVIRFSPACLKQENLFSSEASGEFETEAVHV